MKHYINAEPRSDEYRKRFSEIRQSFLTRIEGAATNLNVWEFRACDLKGQPISWVWDNDTFSNSGTVGTLADAMSFASNMINEGMHFAYASCLQSGIGAVWLTTWESPEEGPVWPTGIQVIETDSHEGICLGTPPSFKQNSSGHE